MSKLILGTAAFGSDYGIKHDGQPSISEIEKIAHVAWDGGIRVIHTSWQYEVPKICDAIFDEFEWITKDMYDPNYFHWGDKHGVSAYGPKDIPEKIDIVSLPINVLDPPVGICYLKMEGIEIHARSVFLQGLLLMDIIDLPDWIDVDGDAFEEIERFHRVCKEYDLEPYEAALGWVLGQDAVDKVIVGVNSAKQLEQLVKVKPLKWDYDFSIQDEMVLDPRRWPKS